MNKSTKLLLASVSPVALAAGWMMLDTAPAHATLSVVGQNVTYATENFVGASASSTIIIGTAGVTLTATATTTDFGAGFATFTLSNGATFSAAPAIIANTNVSFTTGSLVSGSTAVTYTVTTASTTSATITLGNFSITNVGTRLASSANTITATFSSIGSATPGTAAATLATSAPVYTFTGTSNAVGIDLANGGSGLSFRATGGSNVAFTALGTLVQGSAGGIRDISGSTTFFTTASDTTQAFINGNLSAFSGVYAATAACAATAPTGAITGTIATDTRSATISPLAVGTTYNICAIANGTTIIPAGTITGSASIVFGARTVSGATYTPGAVSQSASTLSTLSYNGSTATAYYVVGAGSYTSAIRLSNTSTSAGSVFVVVTPDTTGTPVRALLDSTLAAGQSKFYAASDIRSAVGTSVLTASDNRATVVFLSSFTGLRLQNFIINPGGAITEIVLGGTPPG